MIYKVYFVYCSVDVRYWLLESNNAKLNLHQMKNVIFIIALLLGVNSVTAQVIYHRTNHPNVGFGKSSECRNNQYMDFCVNGPLVQTDNMPVGGYVDNGTTMKDWVNPEDGGGNFAVDNSIFGLGMDNKFYLVAVTEKQTLPEMKWAFQNGPSLVKNYVNLRGSSQSKYPRSGVGFKEDGTLVVIVSLTPVTFHEFADLFVQENCSNAIYLDGGPYVGCSDKNGSYGTMVSGATKLQFFN